MTDRERDTQQLLEMQTDMKLLLDCLDYQEDSPAAMKQALVTLSSMLQGSDGARDLFREAGGIQRVLDVTRNTKYDEVVVVGLYCLGSAVECNVYSQKLLSTASVFTLLHGILSNTKSSIMKKQTAAFLMLCLVSNNGFGQALARQSSCLHDTITLIRITLPRSSRTGLSTSSDNNTKVALWSVLLNAASVCVNNPLNEENQRICVSLLPYLLSVLPGLTGEKTISPLLSLIGLTVANSEHNQERVRQCGGLEVFVNKLRSDQRKLSEDSSHLPVIIHLISVLDYCITDNEMNSKKLGFLGGLQLIMQTLMEHRLDDQDKTQAILALAHAVDAYDDNKIHITDGGGIALLIQKLTETDDVELSKTIKYLLHMCVATDKTSADDLDQSDMEPMMDNTEKMKRHSDMVILRKINELDCKLKMMEKPAVDDYDITDQQTELSCDGDNESFTATVLQHGKPCMIPEYAARSTYSSVDVGPTHPTRSETPRERSLLEQLVKEKIERKRLERLNQMLHEDICINRGSASINVSGGAALPVGAGGDRIEIVDEMDSKSVQADNGNYITETRMSGRKQRYQSKKCWETEEQVSFKGNENVQKTDNNPQRCMTGQLGMDSKSRYISSSSTNAAFSHTTQDQGHDNSYEYIGDQNLQNSNASYNRCFNVNQQTADNRGFSANQHASIPGRNTEVYTTVPINVNQQTRNNRSLSANQQAINAGWNAEVYTTVPLDLSTNSHSDMSSTNVQVPPGQIYLPYDLSSAQIPSDQACSRPYDLSLNQMRSETDNVINRQPLTSSNKDVQVSDTADIDCDMGQCVQKSMTSSRNAEIQCGTPFVCSKERQSGDKEGQINEGAIRRTCHPEGSQVKQQVNEGCQTHKSMMINQKISSELISPSKQDINKILLGHKKAVQMTSPKRSVVSLKRGKGDKTSIRGQGDKTSVRGQGDRTSVRGKGNKTLFDVQEGSTSDRGERDLSSVGTKQFIITDKNRSTSSKKLIDKTCPVVILTDVLQMSSAETSDESERSHCRGESISNVPKSTAANNESPVSDTDSSQKNVNHANNDKSSNVFLKPVAVPLKRRVRMTPKLGSNEMPILRGVRAKEHSPTAESMSDILSEFDSNLIQKAKKCQPQSNLEQSNQTKTGIRSVVIKSQNNVRSIDRQLKARDRNLADNWMVAPATPRKQQIRPVRPAFSDCGMRRLVLRSPSSLQSVHGLRKVSMDDSGIHSPGHGGTVFTISPGGFSEDTDIEGYRSNSDVSENEEDPTPSINVNVLRSRQATKPNKNDKCPGCQNPLKLGGPLLNSRTYNIVLETDANTCRRHRELRTRERQIHRDKKKKTVRQNEGRLLNKTAIARESRREKRKGSVYEFPSDSDRPEVSSASNSDEEPGWYLPPRRSKPRRERVPYTQTEEANLRDGVRKLGRYWNQILNTYKFHPCRTNVDLKDKYKRMVAAENRDATSLATTARVFRPFSMCEERRLKRGVRQFGYNWQMILKSFCFSRGRSTEDLRNRWRSMHRGQDTGH